LEPQKITLDELAKYTPWPKRLMSSDPLQVRHKTESEVIREFDREKWARVLDYAAKEPHLTLEKIEDTYCPLETETVGYDHETFWLTTNRHMLRRQIEIYTDVLSKFMPGAAALVELGAGFGSKIFDLGTTRFREIPLVAAEFTENGQKLLRLIGDSLGRPAKVGYCDFRKLEIDPGLVPENSVIFTSLSAHYIPEMADEFIDFLAQMKPAAVVHFEPFYEHLESDSLHDLMARRYIEINDYTKNLMSIIQRAADAQKIEILEVRKKVLGMNPFLPISSLAWKPKKELTTYARRDQ